MANWYAVYGYDAAGCELRAETDVRTLREAKRDASLLAQEKEYIDAGMTDVKVLIVRGNTPVCVHHIKVKLDPLKVLQEVKEYWAGGDCPPDLWNRIVCATTRADA